MVNEENATESENNDGPSPVANSNKLPEENTKETGQGRKYECFIQVYRFHLNSSCVLIRITYMRFVVLKNVFFILFLKSRLM